MKVLKIEKPGKLVLGEGDKPVPDQGEVLVELHYVGFCGSDLNTYLGKNPMVSYPRVPGHEISGVIVERGPGVPEEFRSGDAVTVLPMEMVRMW